MNKKRFYEIPDLKVRELMCRAVLCTSPGQSSNEGMTEDVEGNDYD